MSDIQKSEIEITSSILDLVKNVDDGVFENADKAKLIAALLNRVSNDEDIIDALNLNKMVKTDEGESNTSEETEDGSEGGEDDFDFNM